MISKKQLNYVIIVTMCIAFLPVMSFAQVSLTGEFRPRTELRDGYQILNTDQSDPAFFTSQRMRLNLLFKGDSYDFKISAQDIRTWGEVPQLDDMPNVNIHEAWAQVNFSEEVGIKLGRQELVYDDQRLLGSVNWAQQARSHDAFVLKYGNASSDFKVDLGAAYNQEKENLQGNSYTLTNYKVLSYLWMNKNFGAGDVSGLLLTDGFEVQSGDVNFRYTYGTHINYNVSKNFRASGTLYLQSGKDATRTDISAYMTALKVSYQVKPLTFTGGIDYLSGGKAGDDNPAKSTFNTLYATNHKFYGHMDYFLNIPAETQNGGLQDIYVSTNYTASEKVSVNATYHHFSLTNEITDPGNAAQLLNQSLASEIDFSVAHRFTNDIRFQVGYSLLFSDESLERIQNRDANGLQQWAWVMLVISPKML
ncbi:MAG: alginate export family protein [Gracilimonas sp.]|uniref:alginate export family protein n=1 Tax=Gracilimonas sp. TaxID=1974203 RepID=UPI00199323EA|nr:alginate export family protein [Gracilimonas sp.]MBD3615061.1 alginate export family protein [Gracilimonas sp.]